MPEDDQLDEAMRAFDDLRAEVAVLRRAVDRGAGAGAQGEPLARLQCALPRRHAVLPSGAVLDHEGEPTHEAVERVLDFADDESKREWGLRMIIVSRCLERIGDHAVDIGEQTAYLVTGEFREFTDASHQAGG